jgi:Membrane-bound serine protease (ClpP class)
MLNKLTLGVLETGLLATFWQEVDILFSEISVGAAVCLGLGIVFIIIEVFSPGFGFFGISGLLLLILGIVLRVVARDNNGNPLFQILLLLLLSSVIIIVAFIIMSQSAKKGWLSRTPIIMADSAVPTGITGGTADYTELLGKDGVAQSMLRPAGIATIDGKRYDVVAEGAFIDADTEITVSKVEGVRIVVRAK